MAAGEGRMSHSTGGDGGSIYRYAYILYKPGPQEKKGCPGEGGKHGRRRRKDVPFHKGEGGNIYRYAYIIVYKLNQGRRKDVPFHRWEGRNIWPQDKEGCPAPRGGGGEGNIYGYAYNCI